LDETHPFGDEIWQVFGPSVVEREADRDSAGAGLNLDRGAQGNERVISEGVGSQV